LLPKYRAACGHSEKPKAEESTKHPWRDALFPATDSMIMPIVILEGKLQTQSRLNAKYQCTHAWGLIIRSGENPDSVNGMSASSGSNDSTPF